MCNTSLNSKGHLYTIKQITYLYSVIHSVLPCMGPSQQSKLRQRSEGPTNTPLYPCGGCSNIGAEDATRAPPQCIFLLRMFHALRRVLHPRLVFIIHPQRTAPQAIFLFTPQGYAPQASFTYSPRSVSRRRLVFSFCPQGFAPQASFSHSHHRVLCRRFFLSFTPHGVCVAG